MGRDKPAANNPGRAAMGLYQKQVGRAQRERASRKAAGAGGADYPSSTISQQTALPTESVRHIEIQTDEHSFPVKYKFFLSQLACYS